VCRLDPIPIGESELAMIVRHLTPKVLIITFGEKKAVPLTEISRNLKPQSEIYSIQEDGEVYLGVISYKTLVFFVTEFADYALRNYVKKYLPEAEVCLSLTRKWIEDDCSVSKEELRAAAYAANAAAADAAAAAADAADAAAYAAAYAAADAAAYAANAAAAAAAAAADAADAAAYAAADAAAYAAGKDKEGEFERQGEFILDFLRSGKHLFLV
jgi:hypothetical protein